MSKDEDCDIEGYIILDVAKNADTYSLSNITSPIEQERGEYKGTFFSDAIKSWNQAASQCQNRTIPTNVNADITDLDNKKTINFKTSPTSTELLENNFTEI